MQDRMCTAILKGQMKSREKNGQFYWRGLFCTNKKQPPVCDSEVADVWRKRLQGSVN